MPKKPLPLEILGTVHLVKSKTKRRARVVEIVSDSEGTPTLAGLLFRGERTPVFVHPHRLVVVKRAPKR